jgi:hypothetical protein
VGLADADIVPINNKKSIKRECVWFDDFQANRSMSEVMCSVLAYASGYDPGSSTSKGHNPDDQEPDKLRYCQGAGPFLEVFALKIAAFYLLLLES